MDTIQGNKIIAEFQSYTFDNNVMTRYFGEPPTGHYKNIHVSQLQYHTSWDWLVEVIRKFRALDLDNHKYKSWVQAIDDAVTDDYQIEYVFIHVSEAITWYNQQA
jgi:hypothetical protein